MCNSFAAAFDWKFDWGFDWRFVWKFDWDSTCARSRPALVQVALVSTARAAGGSGGGGSVVVVVALLVDSRDGDVDVDSRDIHDDVVDDVVDDVDNTHPGLFVHAARGPDK